MCKLEHQRLKFLKSVSYRLPKEKNNLISPIYFPMGEIVTIDNIKV